MHFLNYSFIFGVILMQKNVDCSRILGLFPMPVKSHQYVIEPIMKELAKRGHEVDVISHFPQKEPIERYNDISILGTVPIHSNNLRIELLMKYRTAWSNARSIWSQSVHQCKILFNNDQIKKLLNTTIKYDLFIFEQFGSDCFLGFADYFNVPAIAISTCASFAWYNDRFGLPDNPSFIPMALSPFSEEMNLYERIVNTLIVLRMKFGYYYYSTIPSDQIMKNFFEKPVKDLSELVNDISLYLVNSHYSHLQSRPIPPDVVEIGGAHIGSIKPLNEEFKNLLDSSKNGVILFSLGSMVQVESFSQEKLSNLFGAFAELPHTVIMKSNKTSINPKLIPENVHIFEWVPQVGILCHENTKLFITHGGLLGTSESIFCGVPMLGMPIFGDQELNIKSYVRKNIAIRVDYEEFDKQLILDQINKILNSPIYQQSIKEVSEAFKDRPLSALDNAIYWIEHVIKHKGAPYLKPYSTKLNWFQRNLVDVVAALLIACLVIFVIVLKIFQLLFKLFKKNYYSTKNNTSNRINPNKIRTNFDYLNKSY